MSEHALYSGRFSKWRVASSTASPTISTSPKTSATGYSYPSARSPLSCPIHRDDGSTAVFQGYWVQHHP
jgi:hypothetical protein